MTPRILVVRPDRIGDVILATPVFEALRRSYPHAQITVMVRDIVAPLVRGLPSVDEVMVFDPEGRHAGLNGLFELSAEIRSRRFRIAVVLHSHWKIAAAIFAAGIRYRLGPISKPHSYFFYNRGIRQHRSHVEMHEADYNLHLLRRLGIRMGSRSIPPRVALSSENREFGRRWLMEHGWNPGEPLIVIHPGMGGSALNWPESHFMELIRSLVREEQRVLITGGPAEGPVLTKVQEELGSDKNRVLFYGGPGVGAVDRLAGIFSWASVIVAPSTGPLHLAVALGRPVVSFYPPIRVQSAIRWGPYVIDESRASILVPEVYCGQDFACKGAKCNYFPCMKTVTVTQAHEEVMKQLRHTEQERVPQ